MGGQNYFVPGSDAERPQAEFKGGKPVIHADSIFHAAVFCELFLEPGNVLPKNKVAPVQRALNGAGYLIAKSFMLKGKVN
ncbi:MAG: hypothetical protein AMXMBFR60_04500 [Chloroflexota bacterium]